MRLLASVLLGCCLACSRRTNSLTTTQEAALPRQSIASPDVKSEALKHSQFCTEAAERFWDRHDWKSNTDPTEITDYTSHYNSTLNKCLVDIHSVRTAMIKGKVVESDHIYDALEGTVLGAQLLTKTTVGPDGDIVGALLIKGGHIVKGKDDIESFIPWFKSLMTD